MLGNIIMNLSKEQICIIALAIILICVYFYWESITKSVAQGEKFSTSGLPMSDIDCEKMALTYNPKNINKICGRERRSNVYNNTGNYYAVNGQLI